MPADLQFDDLRLGSDLEFGQSIYEPFGIAQIERATAFIVAREIMNRLPRSPE